MHPIYSAFLRHHLTSTVVMFLVLISGITIIISCFWFYNETRVDSALFFLLLFIIVTMSVADILRNRFFTSKKRLKIFLSKITPEQNARMLAEFRYNSCGEVLAGDFLILLNKRPQFIIADTLTITTIGDKASVSGFDINGRSDNWTIEDESIIEKLRLRIRDKKRSVVCEGGRR